MIVTVLDSDGKQLDVKIPFGGPVVGDRVVKVVLTAQDFATIRLGEKSDIMREQVVDYLFRLADKCDFL